MRQKSSVPLLVGVILITVGLFNPFNLLATLLIDTVRPTFCSTISYPSSTDITAPSIITQIGSATTFWVYARDENSVSSVNLRCTATNYDSGIITCVYDGTFTYSGVTYEKWKWAAPALTPYKVYSFLWLATDGTGNEASITTYGGYGDSDGYFTVNGVQVTSTTQVIKLATRTINVAFTVTVLPDAVVNINVKVKNSGGTLLKEANLAKISSTSYKTDSFYTFTADGSYIIEGYIAMSTKSLQKMSIFGDVGDISGFVWPFSPARTMLMAVGAVLVVYGLRKREE